MKPTLKGLTFQVKALSQQLTCIFSKNVTTYSGGGLESAGSVTGLLKL